MDIETKLVMTFATALGNRYSLTVDDPLESLSEEDIISCMNEIVTKNIFSINDSDLVSAIEAKIVKTDTTEYDLAL